MSDGLSDAHRAQAEYETQIDNIKKDPVLNSGLEQIFELINEQRKLKQKENDLRQSLKTLYCNMYNIYSWNYYEPDFWR